MEPGDFFQQSLIPLRYTHKYEKHRILAYRPKSPLRFSRGIFSPISACSAVKWKGLGREGSGVMDRQPNGLAAYVGPFHPVFPMSRDIDPGSRFQNEGFIRLPELENRFSFQEQHPLVPLLIVPEPTGRCLAPRDDPFNPHSRRSSQHLGELIREPGWYFIIYIIDFHERQPLRP